MGNPLFEWPTCFAAAIFRMLGPGYSATSSTIDSDLQPGVWIVHCLPFSASRTHSPKRRSLLENNLVVLNLATGNCILVKKTCLNFIAVRRPDIMCLSATSAMLCSPITLSTDQGLDQRHSIHITFYAEQHHVWAWRRKAWCKMDRSSKTKLPRTHIYTGWSPCCVGGTHK